MLKLKNTNLNCFVLKNTLLPSISSIPVIFIAENHIQDFIENQTDFIKNWIKSQNFTGKSETFCLIPNNISGKPEKVLMGYNTPRDKFYMGSLAKNLPGGIYELEVFDELAAFAWGMGAYQFNRYKSAPINSSVNNFNQLLLPDISIFSLTEKIKTLYWIRDMINTPPQDMSPAHLAEQSQALTAEFGAEFKEIIGEDLLTQHYPAIHAVGRASIHPPRLIDVRWGKETDPKLTLVGKGVCFDTGGLDIKTPSGMALMKKDMAGAAHVLGLARLIMVFNLPVRLRVLIPAVENVISGNAYLPSDIVASRKGLSIEIGNTDAEGRVILSDALTEAVSENPDLLIDFATLTGAAKIALGTDLPAFFTDDEILAQELSGIGNKIQDPVWRMPLYQPYRKLLDSAIADMNNMSNSSYGGAITAALFLKEFVTPCIKWVHFDIMAWNMTSTPGHPEGGEAQAIRTVFEYVQKIFLRP